MKRIAALDMLRGYALVCIMVDHMPDSVLRNVTLANFMIFDAAELFVLLSGFLVGLVWQNVEGKEGRLTAEWRFTRRSFEVWRALVTGGILLALLSAALLALDMNHTAVWHQYAEWVIEVPVLYLVMIATMWLQPNLLDVLALYVLMIALVPLLVPLMLRWPLYFAAGSVTVWWFAPQLNQFIPNHSQAGFLFNPFGWQMLFYSGVAMALFRQQFMPVLLRYRLPVTVLATGMVIFGMAIVIALKFGDAALPLREALKQVYGTIDKWPLDGTRYLAIMAASWLVAVPLARALARLAQTIPGRGLQKIGRGGLWSFICCVLLTVIGDALQINPPGQGLLRRLGIDLLTIVALWWLAMIWLDYLAPLKQRRNVRVIRT